MIAVDTNVLVGAIQTFDPRLSTAVQALYRQGGQLLCFPQNLVEFWNASPRNFRRYFRSFRTHPGFFWFGGNSSSSAGSPACNSTMLESLRR